MRLLLAEDEKELSEALVVFLEHNRYAVDAVYDGEEALDYISLQEYDGVILDIMMPKRNGIEVLREIRRKGNTVPVLMLTAKTQVDDRVLGLDAGADDYLGKPFAMKELLARIRAMTRRVSTVAADNLLRFGNLTLDRTTFELSTQKGKIHLVNKEFQLLELLMIHPGQVIATERLLEKIWGLDSDVELQVVWVYISYVRKKLNLLGATVQIKAMRNQGYLLVEEEPKRGKR